MERARHRKLAGKVPQDAEARLAEVCRLLQHRVEHRPQIAGRFVDDLQDLANGGLSGQRLVALAPEVGDNRPRIRRRVVADSAHAALPILPSKEAPLRPLGGEGGAPAASEVRYPTGA